MQQDEPRSAAFLLRRALRAAATPFSWPAAVLRRSRASRSVRAQFDECAKFDTRKWTPGLLKHLEWRRFEKTCAAYFEAVGFTTRIARSPSASGGLDIGLCAAGTGSVTTLVHCKAWDAYRIGVKALRELRDAMRAAGVREGIFVTAGSYTQQAEAFAAGERIRLIDGAGLLAKLAELPPPAALALLKLATQGDFLTPTCPSCAITMISRKSIQGGRSFWGCANYPACKETLSATTPVWS
jgi:restriction system protein